MQGRHSCTFLRGVLWFCLVATMMQLINSETTGGQHCLPQQEENLKRQVLIKKNRYPFKLEVSERITHQLVTNVFAIFVRDVLNYVDVEMSMVPDNFNTTENLQRLSYDMDLDFSSLPKNQSGPTMANLEFWVSSETNIYALEVHDHLKESGIVGPPGRFGWFFPQRDTHLLPLMESYLIFKKPETARLFNLSRSEMEYVMDNKKPRWVFDEDGNRKCNMSESDDCSGLFTPSWCLSNSCALLLTGSPDESGFVVQHIKSLHLYVEVAFVGRRLEQVVSHMDKLTLNGKSYVFLTWTPSTLVLPYDTKYTMILFPPCEKFSTATGCKYDPHRLVKISWQKLKMSAKPIDDSLLNVYFTKENYADLLNLYRLRRSDEDVKDIACTWMRSNPDIWEKWIVREEKNLHIGGIFPVSVPEYRASGIITAAEMAVEAVNKKNLLPGYKLKLLLSDGKCRADVVMKSFVDYVYFNQNLVGILGPACSDTVEPLAGVSRYYKTMVISYSAEGSKFEREKYPYFFRTIGENHQYTYVYLQLLQKLQWTQVASLTQDGTKYAEYISSLQDLLQTNKIMCIVRKFPSERERDAMEKYLKEMKSKSARIIIADVSNRAARDMMCQAYKLGMTAAQGYVWFLPLWFTPEWYNTDKYNKQFNESINCTTEEMLKAINGHLGLTFARYASDDTVMEENITVGEWKKEYKTKLENRGHEHSDYGSYAYDAVWTYALALNKLMKTDMSFLSNLQNDITLRHFVEYVNKTDFVGVSGKVRFGKRSSRLAEIHVVQWLKNKTEVVGTFYPNVTDFYGNGTLYLNESLIKWLTPDGKRPTDGVNECVIDWLAIALDRSCDQAMIILNAAVFIILFIIMILVFMFTKRRYDKKVQKTRKYLKQLGIYPSNATLDKWEIPRDRVVINRKLGEGAFGFVYGGEVYFSEKGWVPVAVKTLKVGSTTEEKLDFLSEAEVMKRFDHTNIIKLLGVCMKNEPVYTIMEFMLYGDLKTFLLARRHLANEKTSEESDEVSSKKLTSMALDVARALSYLNELKYVHRDVASRNCLLNGAKVVKLGDFGMTRPMFESDYYKFDRKGMLPVRWMAPESLGLGIFTPSSDVWSYGVLLYEIVTFGSFPFQGLSNKQVLEAVQNGNILKIPPKVKPQLSDLMHSCWNRDAKARPQASEIVEFLANNPRLITPCLDVPLSSVQIEDNGQLQMQIPEKFRKISMSLRNRSNKSMLGRHKSVDDESSSVIMDQLDSSVCLEPVSSTMETWNHCNGGRSVTRSNSVNIWPNPTENSLWSDNGDGVVEPLLSQPVFENRDDNKYVALKATGNLFNNSAANYCEGSSLQADSVL